MHPIGHAQNGATLYVDLINSAAAKDISHQPRLLTLIAEMLKGVSLSKTEQTIEYDLGRNIGYDYVIKTGSNDAVFYAKMSKDNSYSRFIKNAKPLATSFLTIHVKRNANGGYILQNVRIGRAVPPKPNSDDETSLSKPYWAEHAIIFDNQPIQSSSLTKNYPY